MTLRAIALAVAAAATVACAGTPAKAPELPLRLAPIAGLAPAAGLSAILVVRPKQLYADASLLLALEVLLPENEAAALRSRHGYADVRHLDEVVYASYPHAELLLARGLFDPAKAEAAFTRRALTIQGRALDNAGGPLTVITRVWGEIAGVGATNTREQLAIFGHEAIGLERDDADASLPKKPMVGPLRAAELFALRRLAKARPAFAAPPLDAALSIAGDGAITYMLAGPFSGELGSALGGMLSAATAVAFVAQPSGRGSLKVRVVITGAFGEHAARAADKVTALADLVASSSLGRLTGLDHPVTRFVTSGGPEAVTLDGEIDALALARGLRAAGGPQLAAIAAY